MRKKHLVQFLGEHKLCILKSVSEIDKLTKKMVSEDPTEAISSHAMVKGKR